LQDLDGNIIGILGTYEDITDRINAHESLLAANIKITAQSEALRCRLAAIEAGHAADSEKQGDVSHRMK
jgi:hypothetical protein